MNAYVTGATGFVGGRLVRRLLARGDQVTALVRDAGHAVDLAQAGVELVEGDITEKESMREGMRGSDALFHVAGWYRVGPADERTAHDVNVVGTRNVLTLMVELGIAKGVYTSTLAVNGDTGGQRVDETHRFAGRHLSVYDRTKWQAHHQVAQPLIDSGLPLVIVMPGAIYGPGDTSQTGDAMRDYLRGDLPALPQGTAVCWTHVDDAVQGHLLALERGEPGESYIIAGPCHSFVEAYEIAERLTGIPAPRLRPPPWGLRAAAALMRPLEWLLPVPDRYRSEALRVQAGTTYLGRNDKARRELGYSPRSLEEGLRETLPAMAQEIGVSLPNDLSGS